MHILALVNIQAFDINYKFKHAGVGVLILVDHAYEMLEHFISITYKV